jgi:oxygen-dependent protoporphyrinogen oxidase
VKHRVAVVGGGVAGLAAAYELTERAERLPDGIDLVCLEAGSAPGGTIRSAREQGFLCESAANGFLDDSPATLTLVRRLGLASRLVRARAEAARRFVYRDGRLREMPLSPTDFLRSDVLSLAGKARALVEPLVPCRRAEGEESVHAFARRRVGRRAADVLMDAMVTGMYAGDARRLSLEATFPKLRRMEREHGSLFRALRARRRRARDAAEPAVGTLTSFVDGMQELTDAMAAALGPGLRLGARVTRLSDLGNRGFRVHLAEGAPFDVHAVIVACPAWSAAPIVEPVEPRAARALEGIPCAALAVVHLGYREDALGPFARGFGFLVPRRQGPRILGALWASDIFDGRAPAGSILVSVMIGGALDPAATELSDDELVSLARADLQRVAGVVVAPWFVRVVRHPRGIPQYELGHLGRLEAIEEGLRRHPGLWLTGTSLRGISVNACVEDAPRVAERALEFLAYPSRAAAL